jgi:hypothetical protein
MPGKRSTRGRGLRKAEEKAGLVQQLSTPGGQAQLLKGIPVEMLAGAPDLVGLLSQAAAPPAIRQMHQAGEITPFSGDPIRQAAGVESGGAVNFLAAMLDPSAKLTKGIGMAMSLPAVIKRIGHSFPTLPEARAVQQLNRADFIYNDDIPALGANTNLKMDVGHRLQDDAQKVWGGPMEFTPENLRTVADNMTQEAMASFRIRPQMAGWYKANLEEAMQHATRMHPELADDDRARTAFKFIMAVTSNGQKVPLNARLTNDWYKLWKETGEFAIKGSGKETAAMKKAFRNANQIISDKGFDGFTDFINRDFKVRDLKQMGFNVSDELMDTTLKGSVIFGPKIGGGFMQNLIGNYDPATFDRWFVRTWGRHTGTLTAPIVKLDKQRDKFRKALGRKRKIIEELGFSPDEVLNDQDIMDEFAVAVYKRFEKSGFKNKELPLNKTARALRNSLQELNDTPAGGQQRQHMRAVMRMVQDNLAQQGIDMDIADVQAVLWYAEKDLYAKLGVRGDTDVSDYATVFRNLADATQQ